MVDGLARIEDVTWSFGVKNLFWWAEYREQRGYVALSAKWYLQWTYSLLVDKFGL